MPCTKSLSKTQVLEKVSLTMKLPFQGGNKEPQGSQGFCCNG